MIREVKNIEVAANAIAERMTGPVSDMTKESARETYEWYMSLVANSDAIATETPLALVHAIANDLLADEATDRMFRLTSCLTASIATTVKHFNTSAATTNAAKAAGTLGSMLSDDDVVDTCINAVINCYATSRVAQRLGEVIRVLRAEGKFHE